VLLSLSDELVVPDDVVLEVDAAALKVLVVRPLRKLITASGK
jgi:urease accessory protein UreE